MFSQLDNNKILLTDVVWSTWSLTNWAGDLWWSPTFPHFLTHWHKNKRLSWQICLNGWFPPVSSQSKTFLSTLDTVNCTYSAAQLGSSQLWWISRQYKVRQLFYFYYLLIKKMKAVLGWHNCQAPFPISNPQTLKLECTQFCLFL